VSRVTTSIANTGAVAIAEVTQLYIEFPVEADEQVRQLRVCEEVVLQPWQTKQVQFELQRRDLSI